MTWTPVPPVPETWAGAGQTAATWRRQLDEGVTVDGELVTVNGEPVTNGLESWAASAATPQTWTANG